MHRADPRTATPGVRTATTDSATEAADHVTEAAGHATGAIDRGTVPAVGVALLVLAAAALSATVGAAALTAAPTAPAPAAAFSLTVEGDTLSVAHRGGDAVDAGDLRVVVAVDGERLRRQPPVPFFAARGFESGPTGPFNVASDRRWTAGETATVGVAGTNDPPIRPGSAVEVTLYADEFRLATLRATAT